MDRTHPTMSDTPTLISFSDTGLELLSSSPSSAFWDTMVVWMRLWRPSAPMSYV